MAASFSSSSPTLSPGTSSAHLNIRHPCRGRRRFLILEYLYRIPPGFVEFRRAFNHTAPKLSVSSSLSSVLTSGNVVAAAAATGSSSAHAAVASALAQVAITAVAVASGACLSTKVDFLWPKAKEQPGSLVIDGVDVTGYPIFNDAQVRKAIAFAKRAHHGQLRKTGDPYLTHCIQTGRILATLTPSGRQAVDTVVAGILHDVIDDTDEIFGSIEEGFGNNAAKLVAGVSRLSCINELLRRHRRINMNQVNISHEEASNIQVMLLGMIDDPHVVLIKLADRLHNMRTIYALPTAKAQAIAQETLAIWCQLASRLGLWALKAEMEDLCFAVLQPQVFHHMRVDLASMWSLSNSVKYARRLPSESSFLYKIPDYEDRAAYDKEIVNMEDLLQAVLPFEVLLDRRKRTDFLINFEKSETIPRVVRDAGIALESLVVCEEALEQELLISTSYVPGMEITVSSRLKSLYSIYCKMKRKDVSINTVYDARALRVVIGDKNGALHGPAIKCCYSLLTIIHRLWIPIDGELDDYIINPKPSGYQSLHTAVHGPDASPLEVQIRTQRMHDHAEHGLAAHWLYKETESQLPSLSSMDYSNVESSSSLSKETEEKNLLEDYFIPKNMVIKAGKPLLRVDGCHLLAAIVVRVDKGGRELLVAVSFGLAASEAVADRRSPFQIKRWEAYASLYKKVSDKWWFEPGHGDWCTCLEKYTLSRDGMYHKEDQFQRLLPTFIQVIHLTEQEESEYRTVVSAAFEGKKVSSVIPYSCIHEKPAYDGISSMSKEAIINNKVHLLRRMLGREEEAWLGNEEGGGFGEVGIVQWPCGEMIRLARGSTVADAARRMGSEGKLVLVNGEPAPPATMLKDGDIVEFRE